MPWIAPKKVPHPRGSVKLNLYPTKSGYYRLIIYSYSCPLPILMIFSLYSTDLV
ncbi:unknown protein [Microcystis aeruginosa NIES-843]|uniref:Uncharacterized protein n=1 Tax=Microcystis aeruginosa (strain NIES-843 / IAM M-2473) TaxID=449447 RepID=B0JYF6_MICAN|nr:unknown protein [Microcystis aeruginosa NIES-843]